jgi:hypothetical protein
LDFETQARETKLLANQPDFAVGSVQDGVLVLASFSGSQLASYALGAANVIFVVGAQKIVPDLDCARRRIYEHALPLEDARFCVIRDEQSGAQDPRDPRRGPGPDPRGSDPQGPRVLTAVHPMTTGGGTPEGVEPGHSGSGPDRRQVIAPISEEWDERGPVMPAGWSDDRAVGRRGWYY